MLYEHKVIMWSLKRDGNTFLIPTLRHPPRWGVGPTDSGPWLYLSRSPWRPQLPYPLRPQPRNWNPHRTSNLGHSHIPSETKLDCSSRETTAAGGSRQTVDVPTCLNHPAADEATQNSGISAQDSWQVIFPSDRLQQWHLPSHQALADAGSWWTD